MKTKLIVALLLIATLSGCVFSKKSEVTIDEEFRINNPTKLRIAGVIDLRLIQGDNPSLYIEGEEDAVEAVKINENGGSLSITYDAESNIFSSVSTPKITLTLSDLEELTFDGVGNFEMERGFIVDEVKIRGSGIGNIQLALEAEVIEARFDILGRVSMNGSAERMALTNDGLGQVDAEGLIVQNLNLSSNGIGKVDVHCENELSIYVNGIGAVRYSGNPTIIDRQINGIGKVTAN